jgi:uncharacterized membrane protein YkvA (DUF1232 family)
MPKQSWRDKAKSLTAEIYALYSSCRDPRVPLKSKILTLFVIGYFISPIDLIPDFIPVIGQLDDLIIIPAGIALALRWVPKEVMEEYRRKAKESSMTTRAKWIVAIVILAIYSLIVYGLLKWLFLE